MIPEKIAKLIPMLSSPVDAEVVAAARAIERALKADGKDWHDLVKSIDFGGADHNIGVRRRPHDWRKDVYEAMRQNAKPNPGPFYRYHQQDANDLYEAARRAAEMAKDLFEQREREKAARAKEAKEAKEYPRWDEWWDDETGEIIRKPRRKREDDL